MKQINYYIEMVIGITVFVVVVFLNWDSLYVRLNSYYEAWSYKKKLFDVKVILDKGRTKCL